MTAYVVQRTVASVASLLLLSLVVFLLLRALPGGSAEAVLGDNASPAAIERLNREFGFDEPLPQQYIAWLRDLATLNLGRSLYRGRESVGSILKTSFWPSAEIASLTMILAMTLAVPVGTLGAVKRNSAFDFGPRIFTIMLLAVPEFWLGSIVLIVAAREFSWSPPLIYSNLWDNPRQNLQHVGVPALILGGIYSAMLSRLVRSSMLEVLTSDYVRTARAKGLREWTVITRHCLRQSLLPVVTFFGIQVGRLLGGVVIVEVLFSVPGLGQRLLTAINQRDFPVVQGIVLLMGLAFIVVNLLIDMSYGFLDPRTRAGARA